MKNRMILLNPGPANTSAAVKRAMTVADICPRERAFGDLLLSVRDRLTRVVTQSPDYTTVLFCGSGTAGVEAAVSSVVPAGGRLLVVDNGSYGARIAEIAAMYGIPHDVLAFGVGGYPEPADVEKALDGCAYTHLAVIHHETSTGMLNPVSEIAALCRARKVQVIVDAMSSYAGLEIDIEQLGADYLVSSSNKCIQGMAGMAFVVCRRSALESPSAPAGRSYYLNLCQQHRFLETQRQMQFTPPVQVVYALDQALKEYAAEGGAGRAARYQDNFRTLDAGVRALGFHRLLPEDRLSGILTAYIEPDHPNYSFERMHDMLYNRGFTIYPGKGANRATFRLANMGDVTASDMSAFVDALSQVLSDMKIHELYGNSAEDHGN